jgi:[ribosomal protein S5]-alanine N-acetyltransferase
MKHFVEYVFSCTGLKKLTLRTLEDNLRAQKCFTKAGFKPTGVFEEEEHRFLGMEINREDWMKRDQT